MNFPIVRLVFSLGISLIFSLYGAGLTFGTVLSVSAWASLVDVWDVVLGFVFTVLTIAMCVGIFKHATSLRKWFGISGIRLTIILISWAFAFIVGAVLCLDFILFLWLAEIGSILLDENWLWIVIAAFLVSIAIMALAIPMNGPKRLTAT